MIDQGELFQIPNPCRGICEVNNKGYCKGCFRSRQERFHWHEFTEFQKHQVVQVCGVREKRIEAARRAKQLKEQQALAQQKAQFDLFGEAVVYEQPDETLEPENENSPQMGLF